MTSTLRLVNCVNFGVDETLKIISNLILNVKCKTVLFLLFIFLLVMGPLILIFLVNKPN